jgi:hypothetical protein
MNDYDYDNDDDDDDHDDHYDHDDHDDHDDQDLDQSPSPITQTSPSKPAVLCFVAWERRQDWDIALGDLDAALVLEHEDVLSHACKPCKSCAKHHKVTFWTGKHVSSKFIKAVLRSASLPRVLDLCQGYSDKCHEVLAELFQATQRQTRRA